jgi:peptidoglycan hydrolase-like protein with peptidoglycan-binding domain
VKKSLNHKMNTMDVKDLQLRLTQRGYQIKVDGILGPKTTAAVKSFQESSGISPDGIVGPVTLHALGMARTGGYKWDLRPVQAFSPNLATRAMQIALSQNGVREQDNNSGPAVNCFLSSVGLPPGHAWCMAFVYWAFQQAADALGVNNPLVRTGGCLKQWNETTCIKIYKDPLPGDIFIMDLGKGAGHTGIVTNVGQDSIITIEGNTNDNGSANGDGVYVRDRLKSRIKGYIRCK